MWVNRDFRRLWTANLVSSFGTQVTALALPLVAIAFLRASPMQMGVLTACGTLPYLLVGLPAGVWVDRLRRRPLLIAADLGRAVILASIPLLAVLDALHMVQLYLAAFLVGLLSLLYDVAEEAYLPAIIGRAELVEGNSRLAAIDSSAQLAAPVFAGGLVQWLTAPFAVAVDAVSFLFSAFWLSRIQRREAFPIQAAQRHLWQEMRAGMSYLLHHPLLRPSTLTGLQMQLTGGVIDALLLLYLVETLHLSPMAISLMFAFASMAGLTSTLFSGNVIQRFGFGPTVIGSALMIGVGWLAVPLAGLAPAFTFGVIATGALVFGAGNTISNVATASLTQTVTPNQLLGRVNASGLFLTSGVLPLGSLLGGWLGEQWGLLPTLWAACAGLVLAALWVWYSPLRHLHHLPPEQAVVQPAVMLD
jgi:MFS family permease